MMGTVFWRAKDSFKAQVCTCYYIDILSASFFVGFFKFLLNFLLADCFSFVAC
jgi:hypothetical protein